MPNTGNFIGRPWGLLAVILAVGVASFWHNWMVDQHLTFVSAVHRSDHPTQTPLERVRPGFTADVHMWVRYALAVLEGEESLRAHHTAVDNPPAGRAMHWNSGLIAWLAGLGWSWHQLSGTPLPAAVEHAAIWANWPLFMAFVAGFGWWTARRAGPLAGAVVAIACFGHRSIYEGFLPAYPDHHGLIAAGILGLMLGVLFMGGGWIGGPRAPGPGPLLPVDAASARRAAIWSGFWGGFGLWISTASLAVPLALIALSGVVTTWLCRRRLQQTGNRFDPMVWRVWGRSGALTSLGFYLLEYFPHQLGWRLEVNHPLYALAWWGGAELIASLLDFLTATGEPARQAAARLGRTAWALPLVAGPLVAIALGGASVFALADPFMVRLHRTIIEFMPLSTRLRVDGIGNHFDYLFLYPLVYVAAAALLIVARPAARVPVLLSLLPAVGLSVAGIFQSRWRMGAGGAEVPLLMATLGLVCARPAFALHRWRRGAITALTLLLLYGYAIGPTLLEQYRNLAGHVVPADEIMGLTYREIAQTLRDSQPQGRIVLFTSPNASVAIGYYGRLQTLGTLYWENGAGLKAAAEIAAAPDEDTAAALIRRHGVTHLAMISPDSYMTDYVRILHPELSDAAIRQTFGFRLAEQKVMPPWLEPLLYRAPHDLPGNLAALEIYLYKVNFQQTRAEAAYRIGALLALQEKTQASLDSFAWAAQLNRGDASPWLRRGELLFRQRRWAEAADNFQRGIALTAPAQRYELLTQAGISFETAGELARSLEFYRAAIQQPMANAIALNNLAWRLAVARDDALRDPAAALTCAQEAVKREPDNAGDADTLAAALAANQRFDEAEKEARRAVALAEKARDENLANLCRRHAEAYHRHETWRE